MCVPCSANKCRIRESDLRAAHLKKYAENMLKFAIVRIKFGQMA